MRCPVRSSERSSHPPAYSYPHPSSHGAALTIHPRPHTSRRSPGALERFSGFFSEPLFTPSGTLREVRAIESEHSKNLQSDFWRSDAVLRRRARPDHPYSRFFTGNAQTLRGGDADARAALLAFWAQYYRAPQMALAVAGPQSLDTRRCKSHTVAPTPLLRTAGVARPPHG